MKLLDLPEAPRCADLDASLHPSLDQHHLRELDLFCAGGLAFERAAKDLLPKRELDGQANYRDSRVACAPYHNHLAPCLAFLVAAMLQQPPQITVCGPDADDGSGTKTPPNPDGAKYWEKMNDNADGYGNDLTTLAALLAQDFTRYGRAYLLVDFPLSVGAASLGDQAARGELDARLRVVAARDVLNWEYSPDGRLLWVLIKRVRAAGNPFGPAKIHEHNWHYIWEGGCATYTATRDANVNAWSEEKAARGDVRDWSRNPRIPVFQVGGVAAATGRLPNIADQLLPTAKAVWDMESALNFSLKASAYALPWVKGVNAKSILASEVCALDLGNDPNAACGILEPAGRAFDAQTKEIERLITRLYDTMNSAALQLANKNDNGRQSGIAKLMDFGPLTLMVTRFSQLLRAAFAGAIDLIEDTRKDGLCVTLSGLDKFSVGDVRAEFDVLQLFLSIPGIPNEAKRPALARLCTLALQENVDAHTRTLIAEAIRSNPLPDLEALAEAAKKNNAIASRVPAVPAGDGVTQNTPAPPLAPEEE